MFPELPNEREERDGGRALPEGPRREAGEGGAWAGTQACLAPWAGRALLAQETGGPAPAPGTPRPAP